MPIMNVPAVLKADKVPDPISGLEAEPELITDPVSDVALDQQRKDRASVDLSTLDDFLVEEEVGSTQETADLEDDLESLIEDINDGDDLETEECLSLFLRLFLKLNPEPSDEQVHSLAYSLGLSKEAVEELIYAMLSEYIEEDDEDSDDEDSDGDEREDDEDKDDDEGEESFADFIHSPIIDPQNADEEMVNDGREGDRP